MSTRLPEPEYESRLADVRGKLAETDADGAPGTMGYSGPPLSEFVEVETQEWVKHMRYAKSDAEVALIRESARWGNLAHRYLAEFAEPGAHPATASQRASTETSRAMLDTLGDQYAPGRAATARPTLGS